LNIVHISTLYNPFVGGLEIAVQKIAEGQKILQNDVTVVTSNFIGSLKNIDYINGVAIIRVKVLRSKYPYLIYPIEIPKIFLEKANVIHGWSHNYLFVYKLIRYAKKVLRKPIVVYFIGVDYLKKHHNFLIRFIGYPYQKVITNLFIDTIDLALVTNDYEKKLLREIYGVDSVVVPHGIDEIYLKHPNMEKYFREKYGIENRIISFIGRIHPTKGIDLLIKAFALVSRENPDTTLVIAGKGDEKYIRKCLLLAKKLGISNKIIYLGYIDELDKIGLIDSSDVIILPSKHAGESYPIIVNEVKARGKPIVATNYGSLPYLILDGVEGVIVEPDPRSLASGIIKVLFNNNRYRPVTRINSWSEIVRLLEKIYYEVLSSD